MSCWKCTVNLADQNEVWLAKCWNWLENGQRSTVISSTVCVCVTAGGDDYESEVFNVAIPAGDTSIKFNISIIDDNLFERDESFFVTVDSSTLPSRILVQPDCMAVVTIVDDDGELSYVLLQ